MIQIILLILKIIGITLLVLLGLLFLIIALVLFVPVCYRGRVIWKPEQKKVKGRVSFLFPLFFVSFGWLEKLWYRVRAFGFVLLDSEKPREKKTPKENTSKTVSKRKTEPQKVQSAENVIVDEKQPVQKQIELSKETEAPKQEKKQEEGRTKESKAGFFEKLRLKWENVRNTIGNIIDKLGRIFRQKDEFLRIWSEPKTKMVFSFVWDNCKKLLKHIFPRKLKGYVKYGSSDPATTGQVMGFISILYAKTGPVVDIIPNFEEEQLECDLEIRGRIQLFTLLVLALKLFMNQEIKQVIQKFKNIKEVE